MCCRHLAIARFCGKPRSSGRIDRGAEVERMRREGSGLSKTTEQRSSRRRMNAGAGKDLVKQREQSLAIATTVGGAGHVAPASRAA
ncbi:protein of unknown function [Aminobacter niigataensis]|nr:protein of unknown function [Aminobacter niigataensis]